MSQIEKHLKWCLNDPKRLQRVKPDIPLAKKHLQKSEYNYKVLQLLEEQKIYDWALNVGFYAIYHCFLAVLSKHGYESRNQTCTIMAILKLIEENKIILEKDIVLQFDTLDAEKGIISPTIRESREISTYGVQTSINLKELEKIKVLIKTMQKETIAILQEK